MVALATRIPAPRRPSEPGTPLPTAPLTVRPATAADLPRTSALELAAGPALLRLFPALVRWPQRRDIASPRTVTLVCERPGHRDLCGFLVGSPRDVVELLLTAGPDHAGVQRALLRAFDDLA